MVSKYLTVDEIDRALRSLADEFPEACIDAQGVDRAAIHQTVGAAAVNFFDTNLKGGKEN